MGKNYIPTRNADFDPFFKKITQYVGQKTSGANPAWTHIPQSAVTALIEAYAAWYTAWSKTLGDHTSADVKERNRIRKVSEKILRTFIQHYLYEEPVTQFDRDEMSLPEHDSIRSPLGAPQSAPIIVKMIPLGDGRVKIWFADENTPEKRARLKGSNGAVCSSVLTAINVPVTDYKLLTTTELLTASPTVIHLGPEAIGKRFSCALRWQIGHEKGDPCAIASIIVS